MSASHQKRGIAQGQLEPFCCENIFWDTDIIETKFSQFIALTGLVAGQGFR